ncbi:unnamed protein product [Choristocarpus tenellus]
MHSHGDFKSAVDFPVTEAQAVLESSSECFQAAKASVDKLRRLLASVGRAGRGRGGQGERREGEGLGERGLGRRCVEMDRDELLSLAKVAVSNMVSALKVIKVVDVSDLGRGKGKGDEENVGEEEMGTVLNGNIQLDFGEHYHFPVVRVTLK